jgi:hypothetical protein
MTIKRATKRIKERLKEAGYKSSVRMHWGGLIAYIDINIELPERQETIPREEMKQLLAKIFGEEYAEEELPTRTGGLFEPPIREFLGAHDRRSDNIYPHHSIQEREAEALFGWREKKFFCSCTAYYDKKKDRDDCMQSH